MGLLTPRQAVSLFANDCILFLFTFEHPNFVFGVHGCVVDACSSNLPAAQITSTDV